MLAIKRFYWRLNEVKKIQHVLSEMINNQEHDSTTLCSYIYSKGFDDDWSQEDFLSLVNLFKKNSFV